MMRHLGYILLVLLAPGFLFAQVSTSEIKGIVIEQGPNSPIAGVEVTLTEFIPVDKDLQPRTYGMVTTDSRGTFSFKPNHLGDFRINIRKDGYSSASVDAARGIYVVLRNDYPLQPFTFAMYRPGSISGHVVDEDGKAVPSYSVSLATNTFPHDPAVTDADGNFTIGELIPSSYALRVGTKPNELGGAVEYSEDDFQKVDQGYAVAFWPGDAPEQEAALRLAVAPGQRADAGTISLHKVDYYKVHVSIPGDCAAGERWNYFLYRADEAHEVVGSGGMPCRKDFVLHNIARGSYMLALTTDRMEFVRWGLAPVEIKSGNEAVALPLLPGMDVAGRFVFPDGVNPVSLANASLNFRPEPLGVTDVIPVNPDGTFLAPRRPGLQYRVSVNSLRAGYYIKEIRYNRSPVKDGVVNLSAGAQLEFVLDDHPANLSGTLLVGDKPPGEVILYLLRRGFPGKFYEGNPPDVYPARVDNQGHFQVMVAPGDYDLMMVDIRNSRVIVRDAPLKVVGQVKLERGEAKTVDVKMSVAP